MAIATWLLKSPMPVAPGKWSTELQLREVILRFPADAPAGGALQFAWVDADGIEIGDRVLRCLETEDLTALLKALKAIAAHSHAFLDAEGILPPGTAMLKYREYVPREPLVGDTPGLVPEVEEAAP